MSAAMGAIERVSLGAVTVLVGARKGKYPSGNSILVGDEATLLVDPSTDIAAAGAGAVGRGVDMVLNSHAHEDHFAGNHLFGDAELLLHEADSPAMASLPALLASYGMDEASSALWERLVVEQFHFRPRSDVRPLRDGDVLDLGAARVHVVHTPGHTPGHCCLLFEPDGVVYTGDLDLTWFGPYYGDAVASLDDTIASLRRLRDLAADASALVSFHEACIVREDLVGTVDRYAAVLEERDRALLDLCAEPRTVAEIAARCIVYRKRYAHLPWQLHVEGVMMGRHAERLVRLGAMREEEGRYRTC
jgi:glyoxylase-like metal-dependent hydrolase (beta-lactamase superfamily II)